jgi:hypothetical protein
MQANPRLLDAVLLALAIAALPFKTMGCGHTACITVTADQLAQSGGSCPSPEAALSRFMDPNCPNTDITGVDGAGELDGELCCYPVEQNTGGPQVFCGGEVSAVGVTSGFGVGMGGASSFVSSSSFGGGTVGGCGGCGCNGTCGNAGGAGMGGSGFGGSSTVTTGFGGTGGDADAGCTSCAAWLSGASASNLCPSAQGFQQEVVVCACEGEAGFGCVPGGACSPDNLCQGASPSSSCLSCLMAGCAAPITSCQQN